MNRKRAACAQCAVFGFLFAGSATALADPTTGIHWPGFRGESARGVAGGFKTAATWNGETGENVAWKTPIPGLGLSSPIVWGDKVYVTTAVSENESPQLKVGLYGDIEPVKEDIAHSFRLLCLDKKSGKILWDKEAYKGVPKVKRHPKSSHANCTPATDGKSIVAFFGSEGLYCFDMNGELKWKKDLGLLDSGYYIVPPAQWGFASSPVVFQDKVIIQSDIQKGSFLAVFNLSDGVEVWRVARDEVPTWSTPTIHKGPDRTQIICNGFKHIGGYDFATGKELWKMRGGGDIPVPTPVVAHDLIYLTNAHGMEAPIYAVKTSASGDISLPNVGESNDHIPWSKSRRGNYMQTPLVYGDYLYMCKDNGIYTVYEAKSGTQVVRERLGDGATGFTASSVAGDGKIYFTSEVGEVYVVAAGTEFKVLGRNPLGESSMATPAISEGTLFIRGQKHLFAIANE